MVAPILAAEAAKRAKSEGKGLTGDLFVQKWIKQKGSGKNAVTIERELHINPVVIGVGAAATAVGALTALWLAQMRVSPEQVTVNYGKWVWSDGSAASREIDILKRGIAPTRKIGDVTVWKLYVGGVVPYITVPEGTEGAVQVTVPQIETATWTATESKSEYQFAIRQRRGFSILGGATNFPDDLSDVAKPWWSVTKYSSPLGFAIDQLVKK